ncbi:alanine racemase [Halothiobacillus sp. DCM-1]|uniref:alanine racemase n=1 Tax=Halothiobacillus sp. DCM-1 TaxID=3112558 RepID=UPI003252FDBD
MSETDRPLAPTPLQISAAVSRALRRAELTIDLAALEHNAGRARSAAAGRKIFVAVKADGYGHGAVPVAQALRGQVDGWLVATLAEGEALRQAGLTERILVLQGVMEAQEARRAAQRFLEPVFHHASQIDALGNGIAGLRLTAWIKLDTGMHRVGFRPDEFAAAYQRLSELRGLRERPGILTHFARADEPDEAPTRQQKSCFDQVTQAIDAEKSLCNSAALLRFPDMGGDWVRPGIMIYGGNPTLNGTAADWDLRPVMTLRSRLLAVRQVAAGDEIGYGGRFVAPERMPVGVVAVGYGDGYPRHAPNGTPILVNGQRTAVLGRVSMDLVTVDLRGIHAKVGDEVVCWGDGLPIDEVAQASSTISYELMCQMSGRVFRQIVKHGG